MEAEVCVFKDGVFRELPRDGEAEKHIGEATVWPSASGHHHPLHFENIISSGETTKGVPDAEEEDGRNKNFSVIVNADEESKCEEAVQTEQDEKAEEKAVENDDDDKQVPS